MIYEGKTAYGQQIFLQVENGTTETLYSRTSSLWVQYAFYTYFGVDKGAAFQLSFAAYGNQLT